MSTKNTAITAKDRSLLMLWLATAVTIIVWFLPFGNFILYPFTILGTWFHEMGHGLTSLILGGSFVKLEIFLNGSGSAYTSRGALLLGESLENALVAAGGLVGAPIVGALFMLSGRNAKVASISLYILALLLVASLVIWVRSSYGLLAIGAIAFVIILIAFKGSANVKQFVIQFLGVQAILNTYQSIGYLFTEKVVINGESMLSDTGSIAKHLILPYWFWASAILCFSVLILFICYRIVYSEKNNKA